MSTSLDSLVNNLPEKDFTNLKKYYTSDKFSLVKKEGVYPYEYMNSLERLKENKLHQKNHSIPRLREKVLVMKIINMLKKFGKSLK